MTTSMLVTARCALCGGESLQQILASTSSYGPPDLDLRPNGPARWALQFEVQHCPHCGYCAERIGERAPGAERAVVSVIYCDVLERAKMPALARHFFCAALVAEAAERRDASSELFSRAAWVCDDAGAAESARVCRQRAAEMIASAVAWGDAPAESPVVHGVRADLLWRAGRYEEAIHVCAVAEASLDPDNEEERGPATVLAFIRELAEAEDDNHYTVAEAFASGE